MKSSIIYKDESYAIIGDCFNVYKNKENGFKEAVYQECLEIEFGFLKIPFLSQPQIPLEYRGRPLKQKFQPDFICYGKILLEIKAVAATCDEHRSQVLNYLNATGLELALLVNFGTYPKLEYERLANTFKANKAIINSSPKEGTSPSEDVYI